MHVESKIRKPLITGGKTLRDVSNDISARVEEKPSLSWLAALGVSLLTLGVGAYAVYRTLWDGIGMLVIMDFPLALIVMARLLPVKI